MQQARACGCQENQTHKSLVTIIKAGFDLAWSMSYRPYQDFCHRQESQIEPQEY